ncbi:Lipid II:glycine glycyltransferase (Peptidoglycan interpeptide bridge formation enzyme) [Ruminococcaceae bacterium D5]|nr:Lipid II:glycine glycyltransferase (Peptidoglycan interpeptide bridge formation enzyme) [Ruminococcaceae bacterium D5]
MNAEILTPDQYGELDRFVASHPQSSFTQCSAWRKVKSNWGFEAVVCRDEAGRIIGSVSVLIQKIPLIGTCFLYAPRGPVCDLHNREVLRSLKSGVDLLARRHHAHAFKMDPDVSAADEEFLDIAKELGFRRFYGPDGFETIQARFNYRLYFEGRNEEQLLMNLTQQTRRNLRIAIRDGVEVRPAGPESLDEFMRLMTLTGERDGFATRPKAYFERFLAALGEHARLYLGFYEGRAISGAITTNFGGKACYVYGASDNECRNHMPNYLMQWEMIRWALETGCTVYDFQGVSGNLSPEGNHMYGLYRFKKGFNGQLDELAGEFDYVYRPLRAKMVDRAIILNDRLRHLRTSRRS